MRKRSRIARSMAALAIAAGAMFIGAPTATAASCQTNPDVGDICKVLDVACRTKPGAYLEYCR